MNINVFEGESLNHVNASTIPAIGSTFFGCESQVITLEALVLTSNAANDSIAKLIGAGKKIKPI